MSVDVEERKEFEAPADGVFRVSVNGIAHEFALEEGETIALEWEADVR